MKTVVITGGSSGIGRAAATAFAAKGWRVYELSRHGSDFEGVRHIGCDVTKAEDCQKAVSTILEECGAIDVLVSNAGMGISGAVEMTTEAEIRRQFDVNFFGTVNITQAVIPSMRERGEGRIVFVSSLTGVFPIPFQAFYSATKSAVNSLALGLRNELRPFGVKVTTLIPGDVKTGFTDSRAKSMAGSDIYKRMERSVKSMEKDEQNGITPERMARCIVKMATVPRPYAFYTVGAMYRLFIFLNKVLPASLVNRVVSIMY